MDYRHYKYYIDDPVHFTEDIIMGYSKEQQAAICENRARPHERLEPESIAIMNAVAKHDFVAVRSGHGISKTFTIACLIWWFMFTRAQAQVVLTGPKFDQLKATTWKEVNKWLRKSPHLKREFKWSAEKIYHKDDPGSWFGIIVTASHPENIQGFHGDHLLVVADEASGIDDPIHESLLGCLTGEDNKFLACGNPTKITGWFKDAHTTNEIWCRLHFSSEKSAIVKPEWLDMMAYRYHRDSDPYRVRVLGEFPKGNPKAIIQFADVEEAKNREVKPGDFLEIGVDPAFEGNDLAAIAIRQGYVVHEVVVYPKCKPQELNRYVIQEVRRWRKKTGIESKIRIKIDQGGGFGSALIEYITLNEKDNVEAVPVNFGTPYDDEYKNVGAKMWFNLGDIIHLISLPEKDDNIAHDLYSREWVFESGKVGLESKDKYKEREGRSPDRGDAMVLAFWGGPKKVLTSDSQTTSRAFDIDWKNEHLFDRTYKGVLTANVLHYCALAFNDDLSTVGLAAIYDFFSGKLWVYGEIYHENPIPLNIANSVKNITRERILGENKRPIVLGTKKMFHKESGRRPLADMILENGLYVGEAYQYDEFGAIAHGQQMYNNEKIVVHSDLKRARGQIGLWAIDRGKPSSANDGYCRALLLILSELRRRLKEEAVPKYRTISKYSGKPHDYHDLGWKPPERNNKLAWMTR